ncbi:aldose epimerase family protein [Intestinibacter sp.]|uniref:aldose epimerase family protein n=1 Tax=Intestinibacter sp. TaxID=1965304 RepID=UPI003F1671CA
MKLFGITKDNKKVFSYTISDKENHATILNYGAVINSLVIKNKNDKLVDVVLGFDNIEQYEDQRDILFMGAVCGRYANRIANGKFYINNREYNISQNDKGNCLHSGESGFDKRIFDVEEVTENSILLSIKSEDGDGGFPGEFLLKVRYTLENNSLKINYSAKTTKDCPVNITNHSYFNLTGNGDILNHKLKIYGDYYMDLDENGLANGKIKDIKGTPFDFSDFKEIKSALDYMDVDNHFYADTRHSYYNKFATLCAPDDSLSMDIYTDQCGAQVYTGNSIPSIQHTKSGPIKKYSAICFETQSVPNALEFSYLPSPILKAGEIYSHNSEFKFY